MTVLDEANTGDKRGGERQRVLLAGKLVYGEADLTVDCGIRNLSSKGARVRLAGPELLPSEVRLIELRNGRAYDCIVTWRRSPEFGLKFVRSYDLPEHVAPEAKIASSLKRIWLENTVR